MKLYARVVLSFVTFSSGAECESISLGKFPCMYLKNFSLRVFYFDRKESSIAWGNIKTVSILEAMGKEIV